MSKIAIAIGATDGGKTFLLPPDVVTSTLVVYGGKGMGKTNLGSVVVEELSKSGLRWVAADPLGVWWGLRHNSDGKGPGIECVILGGAHGDIPIEPTGGAVVADLVVDEPGNVIIDFSRKPSGEMWGVGEKVRFLTDYAKRLFQRQGGLVAGRRREPLLQILDEAARYIPQIVPAGNPDLAKCVAAWDTLVEEGRNIGIGILLLTQRSARMNKSVSEVADAMFSFRIVGPNSIAAVTDWLGEHVPKERIREYIEKLRSLDRGRCLIVSPGWLGFEGTVDIRPRETFDSSATPKPGEKPRRVSGQAAKPDLAKYSERMKETIERAKAEDPKELRKQVQQLRVELDKARMAGQKPATPPAAPPSTKQIERAVQQALKQQGAAWASAVRDFQRGLERRFAEGVKTLAGQIHSAPFAPPDERTMQPAGAISVEVAAPAPRIPTVMLAPSRIRAQRETPSSGDGLPRLGDLHFKAAGILAGYFPDPIKTSILAVMCGRTVGGSWSARLSELRAHGLLEDSAAGWVRATDKCAQEYAGTFQAPRSTDDVLAIWNPKLGDVHRAMLQFLVETGGEAVTRHQLAEAANLSVGGSFSARLSELRSTGLISEPGRGMIAANQEALFLKHPAA